MNKKLMNIITVVVIVLLVVVSILIFNYIKHRNESKNVNKIAIIYFSATGTTETVAKNIQSVTQGNLIEIVPKEEYTSADLDYSNDCRANREQNDDSARPEIANTINLGEYDTIYLGYPIWWGDVPKVILTFLDTYNLEGKTIIPFCTSGSSSILESMNTLRNYNNKVNWIDGKRFNSSASQTEIEKWVVSIKK